MEIDRGSRFRSEELWRVLVLAAAVSVLVLMGCGSSATSNGSVEQDFRAGISQIRGTRDYKALRARLARTLTRLREDRASTAADRRAKPLAIQGFDRILSGIDSRIDFDENDSGNVEAATRDAKSADRSFRRGARLLRAAGRILGVHVGSLRGF